jgi:holo-[acyl-carrier protein] synthase
LAIVIVGIGTDIVGVRRFAEVLARTPSFADRVFTEAELVTKSGSPRSVASLAARFAAKEAAVKTLGAPRGYRFRDCEVIPDPEGRPFLKVSGVLADTALRNGVTTWHLSLTHDADLAAAIVVAEARPA